MIRLCAVTYSPEFAQGIQQAGRGDSVALNLAAVLDDPNAVSKVLELSPMVVVLDVPAGADRALLLAEVLAPIVPTILRADQPEEVALHGLRAGVRDVLPADAPAAAVWDAAERTVALFSAGQGVPMAAPQQEPGRVITVLSPKGGVGKTTVATNLAVGLARALPQQVVLVDLDLQFGDVASALDLDPEFSIVDGVKGAARRDAMVLKTYLTQHRSGLYVVAAPANPADADQVSAPDAADLLQRLAAEFRYVLVDTAPGLNDHALAALDASTDLVLLTALDVPGVRGLRKHFEVLAELGIHLPHHVVLNMVDKRGGLTVVDAAATISAPVDIALPRCKSVLPSVNSGVPVLEAGISSPFASRMEQLLRAIAPDLPPVKRERMRFGARRQKQDPVAAPRRAKAMRPAVPRANVEGGQA